MGELPGVSQFLGGGSEALLCVYVCVSGIMSLPSLFTSAAVCAAWAKLETGSQHRHVLSSCECSTQPPRQQPNYDGETTHCIVSCFGRSPSNCCNSLTSVSEVESGASGASVPACGRMRPRGSVQNINIMRATQRCFNVSSKNQSTTLRGWNCFRNGAT